MERSTLGCRPLEPLAAVHLCNHLLVESARRHISLTPPRATLDGGESAARRGDITDTVGKTGDTRNLALSLNRGKESFDGYNELN